MFLPNLLGPGDHKDNITAYGTAFIMSASLFKQKSVEILAPYAATTLLSSNFVHSRNGRHREGGNVN